jgi:hypothetical protein
MRGGSGTHQAYCSSGCARVRHRRLRVLKRLHRWIARWEQASTPEAATALARLRQRRDAIIAFDTKAATAAGGR